MQIPTIQCVKIDKLRTSFPNVKDINLEKWVNMMDGANMYIGRPGKIYITESNAKRIYYYKGSKWANPYKVGKKDTEYKLEDSLRLYEKYIRATLYNNLYELSGKILGCFCDTSKENVCCHAHILIKLFKESVQSLK